MLFTVWIITYMDLSQGDGSSKKQEQYWRFHFGTVFADSQGNVIGSAPVRPFISL